MDPADTDLDRPAPPSRRAVPRGVVWASLLATVVLAIATVVAFTADDGNDATRLDLEAADVAPAAGDDVTGRRVPDVAFERFDGTTGSFDDYAGRPLVINFFASWCTPCVEEMPAFEQVHQDIGDRVAFLGLNVTEQPDSARALIERTGITYDTARDPSGELLRAFGGANMPTTAFVDADGTIRKVHVGRVERAELERIIADELDP